MATPEPPQPSPDEAEEAPPDHVDTPGYRWVRSAILGGAGGLTAMLGLLAARQPNASGFLLFFLVVAGVAGAAVAAPAVEELATSRRPARVVTRIVAGGALFALAFVVAFFQPRSDGGPPDTTESTVALTTVPGTTAPPPATTGAPTTIAAPADMTTSLPTTTTTEPDPREQRHVEAADRAAALVDDLVAADEIETLVGQLVVPYFPGPDLVNERFDLEYAARLMRDARVGGILISASNCNINNGPAAVTKLEDDCANAYDYAAEPDTVATVADFTLGLQTEAFEAAQELAVPFVPLFIAVDHEGDGAPRTHLRNGFHTVPSQLAIGATWDVDAAREVGRAVGSDLAGVGVNLLLGPVVDVMSEKPKPTPTDIGIRTFGSSPELVSAMAAHYIEGVNDGSTSGADGTPRVLTIVKHFPGHGASNEDPDTSLSHVTRVSSIAALDNGDVRALTPFGELTGEQYLRRPGGFMSSHLLYPNVAECGPGVIFTIGVDCAKAFWAHMSSAYPSFDGWRETSLMVTDALGVQGFRAEERDLYLTNDSLCDLAVRAVETGHDLLLLGNWSVRSAAGPMRWGHELESVRHTVDCLASRFRDGERDRLEESAARVLKAKFLLYPELGDLADHDPGRLELLAVEEARKRVGADQDSVDEVAARAVTEIKASRTARWSGIANTPQKSIVFVECWADGGELCDDSDEGRLPPGVLETLTETEVREDFAATGSVSLLDAWCALPRLHSAAFEAEFPGGADACDSQAGLPPQLESTRQDLFAADVVIFGVNATNPGTNATFAVEDVARAIRAENADVQTIMIGTNRPYYRNRSALNHIDLYVATYSKIEPSVIQALNVSIRGFTAAGDLPVAYAELYGPSRFDEQVADWLGTGP